MPSVIRPGGAVNPSGPIVYRQNDLPGVTRLSLRTIQRLRKTGQFPLPDRMIGRSPLWAAATVQAWLAPSITGEV